MFPRRTLTALTALTRLGSGTVLAPAQAATLTKNDETTCSISYTPEERATLTSDTYLNEKSTAAETLEELATLTTEWIEASENARQQVSGQSEQEQYDFLCSYINGKETAPLLNAYEQWVGTIDYAAASKFYTDSVGIGGLTHEDFDSGFYIRAMVLNELSRLKDLHDMRAPLVPQHNENRDLPTSITLSASEIQRIEAEEELYNGRTDTPEYFAAPDGDVSSAIQGLTNRAIAVSDGALAAEFMTKDLFIACRDGETNVDAVAIFDAKRPTKRLGSTENSTGENASTSGTSSSSSSSTDTTDTTDTTNSDAKKDTASSARRGGTIATIVIAVIAALGGIFALLSQFAHHIPQLPINLPTFF